MSCAGCQGICKRRDVTLAKRHGELCATKQKYSDLWDQMYGVADDTVIPESYSLQGLTPADDPDPIAIMGELSQISNPTTLRQSHKFRLGDTIEKALSIVGITADRVEKITGRKCGCSGRKKKLNRLSDWAQDVLAAAADNDTGLLNKLKTMIPS